MALNLNGNFPKKILFNGGVVWIAKILQFLSGYPLTLENSTGENLVDYKIYGNQDPEAITLPDEYVRLDYIESTGTQYINTGFKPTIYTSIETVFSTKASTTDTNLFGSRGGWFAQDYTIWINTSSNKGIACHFPIESSSIRDTKWVYTRNIIDTPTKLLITPENIKVNDELVYTFTDTRTEYTPKFNAYIFARNENRNSALLGRFKVYYFNIWDEGQLVRKYVPCYRVSDEEAGLYDLVENTFYGNSGTGDFVAGEEITTKVGKVGDEYYKEGKQLYKIPIKVSNDTETEYGIYLNKPLGKIEENADYIDFKNQEVAYYDYLTDTYTKESIELPKIPTKEGTNIITVETLLKPSKIDIKYYKKGV